MTHLETERAERAKRSNEYRSAFVVILSLIGGLLTGHATDGGNFRQLIAPQQIQHDQLAETAPLATPFRLTQLPSRPFEAQFTAKGIQLSGVDGLGRGWRIGFEVERFGRLTHHTNVAEAIILTTNNTITYRRDQGLLEWYRPRSGGIEQGFTLQNRCPGSDPIIIEGVFNGGYPRLVNTTTVQLWDGIQPFLQYDELMTTDANGRFLPSAFEVVGSQLRIVIDDSEATYPITVDPVIQTPVWSATGQTRLQELGREVAGVDVNGDGFGDVLVGSPGSVSLYLGGVNGLPPTASWTARGPAADGFGIAVSSAGDINGDGYDDVIVGSPAASGQCSSMGTTKGRAYVWFGGESTHDNPSGLGGDGSPENADIVLTPPRLNDFCDSTDLGFGSVVGSIGDFNLDGFDDVFVGDANHFFDRWYPETVGGIGAVAVYTGALTGLVFNDMLSADSTECKPVAQGGRGPAFCQNAGFGTSIAAGDVDGDGRPDLVVTTPKFGEVYVFKGGANGFDQLHQQRLFVNAASVAVGDVNGDSYADILVTTHWYIVARAGEDEVRPGNLLVYYGTRDGVNEQPAESYTPYAVSFSGGGAFIEAFTAVTSAGDVNLDGFEDFLVSAVLPFGFPLCERDFVSDIIKGCDPRLGIIGGSAFGSSAIQSPRAERVYVVHGSVTGLSVPSQAIIERPNQFWCTYPLRCFGASTASAGDINSDGFGDVVISGSDLTPLTLLGQRDVQLERAGASFVFVGSGLGINPTRIDFGALPVGQTSTPNAASIVNGGVATTLRVTVIGNGISEFRVSTTCDQLRLMPGQSCTMTAEFMPKHAGLTEALVNVSTDRGESFFLALSGVGLPSSVSSPAPPASDRTIVDATGPQLNNCLTSGQGPIRADLPIGRAVTNYSSQAGASPLNGDGTITEQYVRTMINEGVIWPEATLGLMVYNDSRVHQPGAGFDIISFNGQEIRTVGVIGTAAWHYVELSIPIRLVRFPERAMIGSKPIPRANSLEINIDTTNTTEVWCTALGWASLTFKAMSPIVMIHGNGSNGAFWVRQGFKGFLDAHTVPNDNSISMSPPEGSIVANARQINNRLPGIVSSFGADSVHLVAHSKGGLDTREWLATYYTDYRENRRCGATASSKCTVLSLSTLSSPHRGSAGADALVAWEHAIWVSGTSVASDVIALKMGASAGTPYLTTYYVSNTFNPMNVPRLPQEVEYRAIGADLDVDGDGHVWGAHFAYVGAVNIEDTAEWGALTKESAELKRLGLLEDLTLGGPAGIVDTIYHFMHDTNRVELKQASIPVCLPFIPCIQVKTWYYGVAKGTGASNDMMVTTQSAAGPLGGPFAVLPSLKRNHADIANAGVAAIILPYLLDTERRRGGWR